MAQIRTLRDVEAVALQSLAHCDHVDSVNLAHLDLGTGRVLVNLATPQNLFFQVLSEITGFEVSGDHHLMRLMQDLSVAKKNMTNYRRLYSTSENTATELSSQPRRHYL